MLQVATNNLERAQALFDKGWTTKAQLDDAIAQHDRNEAAVAEAEKRIVGGEASRPLRHDRCRRRQCRGRAPCARPKRKKNLGKRKVFAPADGTVEEIYFRPGEVVNAGQGVVALLPPRNLKVRFFVAEPERAALRGRSAHRRSHATAARPTSTPRSTSSRARPSSRPPVIFSREQRQKLVYLVEARPEGAAAELTAGQPVTVTLGPGEQMVRR